MFIFSRQPGAITAAKLPGALKNAGWDVAAMYRPNSLLASTKYVDRRYECPSTPAAILPQIILRLKAWRPDFVVPGDMWSLQFLQGMMGSSVIRKIAPDVARMLELSLGSSRAWSILSDKHVLLQETEQNADIATPVNVEVRSGETAVDLIESIETDFDYPVVVKQAGNSGGAGVRICNDGAEVQRAIQQLTRANEQAFSLHSLWRTVNSIPFMTSFGDTGSVSIQEYIRGTPFLHSFVAVKGRLIAGNTVRRERPYDGPMSPHCRYLAARVAGIEQTARSVVRMTGFSGFGCLDFIRDDRTGRPYLIECNPIPVNVAHLGGVVGVDLCRALRTWLNNPEAGKADRARDAESGDAAVLFPYELMRDPKSTALVQHPEDVPYDDPDLLDAIQRRFDVRVRREKRARVSSWSATKA